MAFNEEQKILSFAQSAASSCIRAICCFLVASEKATTWRESQILRQAIIDDLEGYAPYQSMAEPLLRARTLARERIATASSLLPRHNPGADASRFNPDSRNYHELAEDLLEDLFEHLVRVDYRMIFPLPPDELHRHIKSLGNDDSRVEEDLQHEVLTAAHPYSTLYDFQASESCRFIREEWRFADYDFGAIGAYILRESEAAMRRVSTDGIARPAVDNDSQKAVVNPAGAEPPAKYRRGKIKTGDPIGPIIGSKTQFGFAMALPGLHGTFSTSESTQRTYRNTFDSGIQNGRYWARKAATNSRTRVEVFCDSFELRNTLVERLELVPEWKKSANAETDGNRRKRL